MTEITWANTRVKLGDLKPWEDNPRCSTKKQAARILASFSEFSQVQPFAIGPSFEVYDGHQRLSALLTIHGSDYVVDARQSSRELSDEERRKLIVYLHSGAVGSWDWDAISSWSAPELIDWGMDSDLLKSLKADASALKELLGSEGAAPSVPESKYKEQYGVIVICADEAEQESVYGELTGMGMTCKVVVT